MGIDNIYHHRVIVSDIYMWGDHIIYQLNRDTFESEKENYSGDLPGLCETKNISSTMFHSQKHPYLGNKLYNLTAHNTSLMVLSTE